jgi:integrase
MSSVYKASKGRKIYTMKFKDQFGVTRTASSEKRDKKVAKELAEKIEKDAERISVGLQPLFPDQTSAYLTMYRVGRSWEEFREEYRLRILTGLASKTLIEASTSLDHFERIIKPKLVSEIRPETIAHFISERRKEPGKNKGSHLQAASINKGLRHLKAALRVAHDWGYLSTVPKIRMEREPQKLPSFVTPEHFTAIYKACDAARWPEDQPYPPGTWWKALLVFIAATGWRIGATLAMYRIDLDLTHTLVISRHSGNKGKRDQRVPLHPLAIEHLQTLIGESERMFPWNHHRRNLDIEWHRIQKAAGINLICREEHEHTPACNYYGFHDLRRMFATMNANQLTAEQLQNIMQHKDYQTTQRYIAMGPQLQGVTTKLYIPPLSEQETTSRKDETQNAIA